MAGRRYEDLRSFLPLGDTVVWWIAALAVAQEEEEPVPAYEIVVTEQRLSTAEQAVEDTLHSRGYARILRLGQRSWYVSGKLWRPWVMVHDEGFARVRGVPVLPLTLSTSTPRVQTPSGEPLTTLEERSAQMSSPPPPVPRVTFATQGRRAVHNQRARMIRALEPALGEVRDARWAMARAERRLTIRDELLGIWLDGIAPDGAPLPSAMARRDALVARWRATSPGEAGAWARQQIVSFVDAEIQSSEHPFRAVEIEWANQARPGDDLFDPEARQP